MIGGEELQHFCQRKRLGLPKGRIADFDFKVELASPPIRASFPRCPLVREVDCQGDAQEIQRPRSGEHTMLPKRGQQAMPSPAEGHWTSPLLNHIKDNVGVSVGL